MVQETLWMNIKHILLYTKLEICYNFIIYFHTWKSILYLAQYREQIDRKLNSTTGNGIESRANDRLLEIRKIDGKVNYKLAFRLVLFYPGT